MAAEIWGVAVNRLSLILRFNEAAANGRGNPNGCCPSGRMSVRRFNEAAANGRGNPRRRPRRRPRPRRFNEAAANGRGNPGTHFP